MQEFRTSFSAGQHVLVRDERWTIRHVEQFSTAVLLSLAGTDRTNHNEQASVLTPFDSVTPLAASSRLRHRSRRAVLAAAATASAGALPWRDCWTAADARIDLHAWQLEPARAAITGTMRMLLADGVGLGKTIQAGLIVTELSARGLAERVLVLTPAAIRAQWAGELTSRFALRPVVFDQATLSNAAATLPPDVNPWMTASPIISSIDLVKRPEVRAAIAAVPFDALIVDEAHHLTAGSDRGALVSDLAARIPWVLLLTATPHLGDASAYEYLTSLGGAGGAPMRVFMRSAAQPRASTRRSRLVYVVPTPAERALLEATASYARALAQQARAGGGRLVASTIARRAASSAVAVRRTLTRRQLLLRGHTAPERQPLLPWEEPDGSDDEVSDRALGTACFADVEAELACLHTLTALADAASGTWSKLAVIRRLLRRTCEQAIVFSEYRDVALQIVAGLADLAPVAALHGGLSPREREHAVSAFNAGVVRVLVATDAAGEGLNLQSRCRLVINVELPWMPRRLEQRIGRVDRIGQARRVHALHLAHRDSYEGTVIARLERRRAAARRADAVAQEAPTRAHWARQFARPATGGATNGGVYSSRVRGSSGAILHLLFSVAIEDAGGALVQREVVAVVGHSSVRRLTRQHLRALARDADLHELLRHTAHTRSLEAERGMRDGAAALADRFTRIHESVLASKRPQLWQGSLFDRKREQRARRDAGHVAVLRQHLERRLQRARHLHQLRPGAPRLIAAWLGPR